MSQEKQRIKEKRDTDVINQHTGERWYYSDIVKEHFFHPKNLLLNEPQEGEFDATGMVGSPACILPSTSIQKNPGMTPIKNLQVGERVLGHDGKFHAIRRIFKPKYSSTLVTLKNQLGSIVATPDHLIFAMQVPRKKLSPFVHTKYKKRIPPSWVHAGDLQKGDVVLYPISKTERQCRDVKLKTPIRKKWDFKSRSLPRMLPLNREVLELFGYFVSEGHTRSNTGKIGWTFGEKELMYVKRVAFLVKKYFGLRVTWRERLAQHRFDVAVSNVHLAMLFRAWFGHTAREKRIPEFLLFLPRAIQEGLIKGLWRGDGYFNAKRLQPRAEFVTISPTLLQQLRWLLLRQKIIPSIYTENAKRIRGVNHQRAYRVHIGDMTSLEQLATVLGVPFQRDNTKRHAQEVWCDEDYTYLPIRKTGRSKSFSGRLANLEVVRSHTYATDAFLVHNCGDMMKMWLKVDSDTERIKDLKWKTFGCASAIAATSMFSVMLTENGGMTVADALKVRPQDVMMRLGGLPNRKIHCSVLADKAFQKTANDYFRKTKQYDKIVVEGARVVDKRLNITDKDVEEAVLEGAQSLEEVQQKLKVGVASSEETKTEIEQLIRFYVDKYYG